MLAGRAGSAALDASRIAAVVAADPFVEIDVEPVLEHEVDLQPVAEILATLEAETRGAQQAAIDLVAPLLAAGIDAGDTDIEDAVDLDILLRDNRCAKRGGHCQGDDFLFQLSTPPQTN
ncbi:hypothetical protein SDC9_149977 [bioreactor metagenome]|uniref:Uncharacterized protein n=1 Tax=bioreactor metagenome TaxID=1076179 RepID=A0A645EL94_9ZZZZ